MRLIAIMVVRNEADIVAQALRAAAPLVDLLLVVDAGSDDATAAEVESVARSFDHVVLVERLPPNLPEVVRPQLWAAIRRELRSDDWLVILDADELLDSEVRAKTARAAAAGADHIFSLHANFYYTRTEAAWWRAGRETLADRALPIEGRRRFYRLHTSMPRLWRCVPWLRWNSEAYVPPGLVQPARERVLFRHYQYRDLPQIESRLRTRAGLDPTSELALNNPHWLLQDLEAALSADDDPGLRTAQPGEPLIEDPQLPAIPRVPVWKVFVKRAVARLRALREKPQASRLFASLDAKGLFQRASRYAPSAG